MHILLQSSCLQHTTCWNNTNQKVQFQISSCGISPDGQHLTAYPSLIYLQPRQILMMSVFSSIIMSKICLESIQVNSSIVISKLHKKTVPAQEVFLWMVFSFYSVREKLQCPSLLYWIPTRLQQQPKGPASSQFKEAKQNQAVCFIQYWTSMLLYTIVTRWLDYGAQPSTYNLQKIQYLTEMWKLLSYEMAGLHIDQILPDIQPMYVQAWKIKRRLKWQLPTLPLPRA